jgi:EAL domain-containing protein (putative c-di-GMP-specific phosphodiesterase class I)
MGLKTVAEYVESDQVLALLRQIGVDYVQGSWLHRPEPLETLCGTP